ncbi:MAG: hypothetical protein AB7F89_06055, partial [Pirellulaceae bacterium]
FPNRVVAARLATDAAYRSPRLAPVFEGRDRSPELAAFVCERYTCQPPVAGQQPIQQLLEQLSVSPSQRLA